MNHFLRKIDSAGLFIEDLFWDDEAYPEIVGVPKMTAGSPAVPAILAQDAVAGVQMFIDGQPVTDKDGNPHWITPPKDAVQAVAEIPEVKPVQEVDEHGNLLWTTAPVPAFAGHPIPADLIATPAPGGFYHPKWDGAVWVEGGTAPPPAIPQSVTMRQARLVLLGVGMLPAINAAINTLPEPQKNAANIEWEFSSDVLRSNGFIDQLAPVLGLSGTQIDALFIAASKL